MDKTRELLRLTKEGNEAAREQIILNNVGLIWSVVRRFTNRGYESEDLFQIGSIGLMKAVDKFDLSYDVKFSTYAVPMITGEIRRFLRDDGMIKVSRSLKENVYKIMKAREKFCQQYQREATIEEISEITKITREEIVKELLDQVDEQIKAKRSAQLIELGEKKRAAYEQSFQGKEVEVLVEEDLELNGKEVQIGHTKEYMKIALETNENLKNSIVKVQIGKDSQIIH